MTQEALRRLVDETGTRLADWRRSLARVDHWIEQALVTLHCATERLEEEREEARAWACYYKAVWEGQTGAAQPAGEQPAWLETTGAD